MQTNMLILLLSLGYTKAATNTILCTADFCKNYDTSNEPSCADLPKRCNSSVPDSGVYLPSPYTCNCCEYCLGYLKEGETCSTGEEISDTPTSICGPNLYCDKDNQICRTLVETPCTKKQKDYDDRRKEGKISFMSVRPECDEDGDFVPYNCIPGQICYCVDKNGDRIFGNMDNTGKAKLDMLCSCSRAYHDMSYIIGKDLGPDEFFRCDSNGNYDPLQCWNNKCYCFDSSDGSPIFPDAAPIEVPAISNRTLFCFDHHKHEEGVFYKECQERYLNISKDLESKKLDYKAVLAYELPKCSLDGNYAPVQENSTAKYCAQPNGEPIEGYVVEKTEGNEDLLEEMNCNCALATVIMSSVEVPFCLPNGNYNETQTRRGQTYKVDSNGNALYPDDDV